MTVREESRIDEEIFDFAYEMALRDATLRRAYPVKDKARKLAECTEAKDAVKEYVNAIFDAHTEPDFNEAVRKVRGALKQHLSQEDYEKFSFGNAQKLINMTAKYMFMATYRTPELRVLFKNCHCPMDGLMLEKVAAAAGKEVEDGTATQSLEAFVRLDAKKGPRSKQWAVKDDFKWSKLTDSDADKARYERFQAAVRDLASAKDLCPIEYDFREWSPNN